MIVLIHFNNEKLVNTYKIIYRTHMKLTNTGFISKHLQWNKFTNLKILSIWENNLSSNKHINIYSNELKMQKPEKIHFLSEVILYIAFMSHKINSYLNLNEIITKMLL